MFQTSSAHLQEDTVVHMQHMVLSLTQAVYLQATRNSHSE